MDYYCFELKSTCDSDLLWDALTIEGYQLLYAEEEPGTPAKIYGYLPKKFSTLHKDIAAAIPQTFENIDWQAQWKEASGGGSDGTLRLNLADYDPNCKKMLTIAPGPGFGDLSHPTTQQVLRLMAPHVKDKCIFDIGCGSGILSLAAAQLGALKVYGIDIDADAIEHAQYNSKMNGLEALAAFGFPWDKIELQSNVPLLIAMNMISSEQENAWQSLSMLHNRNANIFTSGVLEEQRDAYLKLCREWGWELISESIQEGWKAFHFRS